MNVLLIMIVFISVSFPGSFLWAADTRQPLRPPAQKAVPEKPEIRSVSPAALRTEAGKAAAVTVNGAFLDQLSRISAMSGASEISDIQVILGPASASSRQITFRPGPGTRPGKYGIRATGAGGQTTTLPLNVFSIEVIPAVPSAITPFVVNTDKITATIKETAPALKPSQAVVITTDMITATIKPTAAALSATEAVVITTDSLTATIKKTEPGY